MPLHVLGPEEELCDELRAAIQSSIVDSEVDVVSGSPGHFAIRVRSKVFEGKTRVQQQQLVYGAIDHFMKGAEAPVHAIDRLLTEVP